MANELSGEHAKLLYDLALGAQKANSYAQAINVLKRLIEVGDPFYTPFALAILAQCYNTLGHRDLETATFKVVTRLPEEQQLLLNPGWVALCYQKVGDLKMATEFHRKILELVPNDITTDAALAELYLLQGNLDEAETLAKRIRERAEPNYQILGRILGAFALALRNKHSESASELLWVGQFIISSGSIPSGLWDYRDLQPVAVKLGANSPAATLLLDTLIGKRALSEFIESWKSIEPAA